MAIYNDEDRVHSLTNAVYALMAEGGPEALTLRRIGERAGVSAGAILSHFGHKRRAVAVCCNKIGRDLVAQFRERIRERGALGLAPVCADDVLDARVWLGICELGRVDAWVGDAARDHVQTKLDLLSSALGHDVRPMDLITLAATFNGLDQAVAALTDPLPWPVAREAAIRALDLLAPRWRLVDPHPSTYYEAWAAFSRNA